MKSVAGRLRLDLAQYRELEAFAEFGSDLDKASQAQLERGARVVEVLKQKQYSPFSMEDQVVSIWAITNGYADDLPVEKVQEFEAGLLDHVRTRHSELAETIRGSGKLEDDTTEKLKSAVREFKDSFADRVGTVESVAAEEGVPDASEPTGESSDEGAEGSETEDTGEGAARSQGGSQDNEDAAGGDESEADESEADESEADE